MCYDNINGEIAIPSSLLWECGFAPKSTIASLLQRGHIRSLQRGCRSRCAMLAFYSLRPEWQNKLVELYGSPLKEVSSGKFAEELEVDYDAVEFFTRYRTWQGKELTSDLRTTLCNNSAILKLL